MSSTETCWKHELGAILAKSCPAPVDGIVPLQDAPKSPEELLIKS
jgi:hypothetical protein